MLSAESLCASSLCPPVEKARVHFVSTNVMSCVLDACVFVFIQNGCSRLPPNHATTWAGRYDDGDFDHTVRYRLMRRSDPIYTVQEYSIIVLRRYKHA